MAFRMANKTTSVLPICNICELLFWGVLLVEVGVAGVWLMSLISTHMSINNGSFWLHHTELRFGIFPICGLNIYKWHQRLHSEWNTWCPPNDYYLLFRSTMTLFLELSLNPGINISTLSLAKIGNLVMWEQKCWNSFVYSSIKILRKMPELITCNHLWINTPIITNKSFLDLLPIEWVISINL